MKCPECNSSERRLVKSRPLLKLIPGTRSYTCLSCETEYTWFKHGKLALKV